MILYRPVGLRELEFVAQSGFRSFPPRLPHQPFLYPVLNLSYAEQIARDWNSQDENSGYIGFVTEFRVDSGYRSRFEIHTVGQADVHQELWIPSDELEEFNRHIVGRIRVIESFPGTRFPGKIDPATNLPQWRQ